MATRFKLHPTQAELSIIQTLIQVKNLWIYILDQLSPEHFSSEQTRTLFSSARKSIEGSDTCTLASIEAYLPEETTKLLANIKPCLTAKEIKELIRIVVDRWKRRELLKTAEEIKMRVTNKDTVLEISSCAESALFHISQGTKESRTTEVAKTIDDVTFGGENYLSTGFSCFDDYFYGLGSGDMIVMAGRPGSGKSALMMNVADYISHTTPCVVFSLEMPSNQLKQRLLCAHAKVDLKMALKGQLTSGHKKALSVAKDWMREGHLVIDDNPILTPEMLRLKCQHYKRKYNIGAVFIDYLQLMRCPSMSSMYEKSTEISKSIKAIANELHIPIVSAAQLNRKSEERDTREPRVSDLRDSGSIEQDSDIVALIHRPGLYEADETGSTNLIIGKNRRGATGTERLTFLDKYTLFVE